MDREKVIKGFADYVHYFKPYCIGDIEDHAMLKDALALLKEQQEQIDSLLEESASNAEIAEGLKELLKEQEAKTGHWVYKKYDDMFMCSSCEKYSVRNDYPYCHWCGAKMEGR